MFKGCQKSKQADRFNRIEPQFKKKKSTVYIFLALIPKPLTHSDQTMCNFKNGLLVYMYEQTCKK